MIIAIPHFSGQVSPRFDCAQRLLLVEAAGGKVIRREDIALEPLIRVERVDRLGGLGVGVVICGGIDRLSLRRLEFLGIEVFAWVTGEVDDALQCYLKGELEPRMMVGMHGCCRGRWGFRKANRCPGGYENSGFSRYAMGVEDIEMPGRDGTGPQGQGPGTGRGMGRCGRGQSPGQAGPSGGMGRGQGMGGGPGQGAGGGKGRGGGGGRGGQGRGRG